MAVSWYRNDYTLRAIQMLLDAGVRTNIRYVPGQNSVDEAIRRLRDQDFPKGINAVIFLLHKPAGQGTQDNVLPVDDPRTREFFLALEERPLFKMGLDSCNVRGRCNSAIISCRSPLTLARRGGSAAISARICGCPLMPEIVFCSRAERTAALSGKGTEKSK